MEVFLRWWGIGPGDEVIIPVYTYCASANVVLHTGAKAVMVDINGDDFNIALDKIEAAISPKTKVIMPVDISGFPCDYDEIMNCVNKHSSIFVPANDKQKKLGRILIAADSAHSFGATYKNKRSGSFTDVSCFSFHAVKNLTTAEGGAVCFNLPDAFDHEEIYKEFVTITLHGQSKDALAKTKKGAWKYDVLTPGYKCNMTDLQAAIGLVELDRYAENLARRKEIFDAYDTSFSKKKWALLPPHQTSDKTSSHHLYLLRIKDISEAQRDEIIQEIVNQAVSVNVHFQPLPLLTAYKNIGYKIDDFPIAHHKYQTEITLPVYYNLSDLQVQQVITAVMTSVEKIINR